MNESDENDDGQFSSPLPVLKTADPEVLEHARRAVLDNSSPSKSILQGLRKERNILLGTDLEPTFTSIRKPEQSSDTPMATVETCSKTSPKIESLDSTFPQVQQYHGL